jgi:hypothetical protein
MKLDCSKDIFIVVIRRNISVPFISVYKGRKQKANICMQINRTPTTAKKIT